MPCGDIRYWSKCEDGHAYPVREHCDKWTCPDCSKKLVAKQALMCADRIEFAKAEYGKVYHYVISFKKVESRTKAVNVAKRFGLTGGSIIEHRTGGRSGNHFHLAAFGTFKIQDVKDFYRRRSILIKKIRIIKNAFKLHRYELGHAYVPTGRQIVAYFGILGNRCLGFKRDEKGKIPRAPWEPCLCPRCGKETYKIFDKTDQIQACYHESLGVKRKILILEWKTRYKQSSIT